VPIRSGFGLAINRHLGIPPWFRAEEIRQPGLLERPRPCASFSFLAKRLTQAGVARGGHRTAAARERSDQRPFCNSARPQVCIGKKKRARTKSRNLRGDTLRRQTTWRSGLKHRPEIPEARYFEAKLIAGTGHNRGSKLDRLSRPRFPVRPGRDGKARGPVQRCGSGAQGIPDHCSGSCLGRRAETRSAWMVSIANARARSRPLHTAAAHRCRNLFSATRRQLPRPNLAWVRRQGLGIQIHKGEKFLAP